MKRINKDFLIHRGDAYLGDDRIEIKKQGDYTQHKLTFVVKADKVLTSDRLVEKMNTLAGGSDDGIEATLDADGYTTFAISLECTDTQDLTLPGYYYDLVAEDADDSTKSVTIASGNLRNEYDVQSPFDGLDLPDTAERLLPILASNFEDQEIIKVEVVNGVKTYVGTDLFDGVFQLDANGDLMPVEQPLTSMYYELDDNGDIQPR